MAKRTCKFNPTRQSRNNQNPNPKPYSFSPIDTQKALQDAPVKRSEAGKVDTFYTGQLDIKLTALTPLIVGSWQFNNQQNKLYPQRLPDGRVLINASSLKGMLRAALSRLLHAPMERVNEHHYTFRPNLAARTEGERGIICLPAIVVKAGDANTPPEIMLLATQNNKRLSAVAITFVKNKAIPILEKRLGKLKAGMKVKGLFNNLKHTNKKFKKNLEVEENLEELNHILLSYAGGLDGQGILHNRGQVYKWTLVSADDYHQANSESKFKKTVPQTIWQHYLKTQDILADDKIGHLAPGYPGKVTNKSKLKQNIKAQKHLKENQLIYVEVSLPNLEIISIGHHYHYRWAYTSSIHKKDGKLRAELGLLNNELSSDEQGIPQSLPANRLLFGYSNQEIGQGDWHRMAGRISPNHAIEYLAKDQNGRKNDRFLDKGDGISLKPLGKPRPSAVEFYLKQKVTKQPKPYKGLKTYGDTLLNKGGDLAGRKYYHHQTKAKEDQNSYKNAHSGNPLSSEVYCLNDSGSTFRFRLHFEQLRLWELGALLAVLEPYRLAQRLEPGDNSTYAHKLGYGKSLGLGSITLHIDQWRYLTKGLQWAQGDDVLINKALDALQKKMQQTDAWSTVTDWLNSLKFERFAQCDYPRERGTIFGFHTTIRRAYMELRRGDELDKKYQNVWNQLVEILKQEENR